MAKRFNRPVHNPETNRKPAAAVRQITLPREGRALEGAYAEAAMQGAQIYEADMAYSKKTFTSTLVWWTAMILFWIAVAWIGMNTY